MSEVMNKFIDKKKAESPFISLKAGESMNVTKLKEIKSIIKQGFSGDEVEVLRLVCDVETSIGVVQKNFDNGTRKFAEELVAKKVDVGASFTITREGEKTQTKYIISNVMLNGKPA